MIRKLTTAPKSTLTPRNSTCVFLQRMKTKISTLRPCSLVLEMPDIFSRVSRMWPWISKGGNQQTCPHQKESRLISRWSVGSGLYFAWFWDSLPPQVDIHPTTLCRLLIILDTIQELSRMSSSDGSTNPRARDLLVMLHYVYWGTVVPPSATATLDAQVRRLCEKLETAHKEGGLDEAWIYIDKETVTAMIPKMKWWRDSARAVCCPSQRVISCL